MRTGNIIEAMEAAKNGARVRRTDTWCHYDDDHGILREECGSNYHLEPDDACATWEIDDQPRRWPSIVEAVKHMEETGDWGRPVGGYWMSFRAGMIRGVSAPGVVECLDGVRKIRSFVSEWETKPAETD